MPPKRKRASSSSARTRPFKLYKTVGVPSLSPLGRVTGPMSLNRTLRYVSPLTANPGASSAMYQYNFGANGLYDPNLTGGGHQPLGFDEYMTFYDSFKVNKSTITMTVIPGSTTDTGFVFGIYLDNSTTTTTSLINNIEQGLTSWSTANPGSGATIKTITKSYNASTFHKNKKFSAELVGTSAANPAELAVFKIWAQAIGSGVDVGSFEILVVIDYDVTFSERRTVGQS